MGETAANNVIVMVDGFRLNPPDLAGPDFSTIPIDEIERIEIVRGAGSVMYGGGAVGGVVNIITKRGGEVPAAHFSGSYGSYETIDLRGSGAGQIGNLDGRANAAYFDTNGYRDNGFLEKKDAGIRAGYDFGEHMGGDAALNGLYLFLNANYHEDEQGFPGGVPIEDIDDEEKRRETDSPDDRGETFDSRLRGGLETDFGSLGLLKFNGALRQRENNFILGFTPLIPEEDQISQIEEDSRFLDLSYVNEFSAWQMEQTLQLGADYYYSDYISERIDQRVRKNGLVENLGFFGTYQASVSDDLSLNLGYRYNLFKGTFRDDDLVDSGDESVFVNGEPFDRNFYSNAFDIGLVYFFNPQASIFGSYATSFRIPNVDEYALAADDLGPQEGRHVDLGGRYRFGDTIEISATFFHIDIVDEIRFDPIERLNRNFEDKTRRTGIEAAVKWFPAENLYLWGNYTYMDATFENLDTFVPLVPKHSARAGAEWWIFDPLLLAVTGTYVGEKFDGNDISNDRFATIDPYTVFDAKLTYTYKRLKVFGGINNIFNEFYETLAFSESYFTMPTRNFFAGIQLNF
jgi:outer membrane receptor protein involved in Fe transport